MVKLEVENILIDSQIENDKVIAQYLIKIINRGYNYFKEVSVKEKLHAGMNGEFIKIKATVVPNTGTIEPYKDDQFILPEDGELLDVHNSTIPPNTCAHICVTLVIYLPPKMEGDDCLEPIESCIFVDAKTSEECLTTTTCPIKNNGCGSSCGKNGSCCKNGSCGKNGGCGKNGSCGKKDKCTKSISNKQICQDTCCHPCPYKDIPQIKASAVKDIIVDLIIRDICSRDIDARNITTELVDADNGKFDCLETQKATIENLTVGDKTTLNGDLCANEKVTIEGKTTVNGKFCANDDVTIAEETKTTINGEFCANNGANIRGKVDIDGDLCVSEDANIDETLNVGSDTNIGGNITVNGCDENCFKGDTTFKDKVDIEENLNVCQNLHVKGDTKFDGDLDVCGDVDIAGKTTIKTLCVSDEATIGGKLTVSDKLCVAKETKLDDDLKLCGDLKVWGCSEFFGDMEICGNVTIKGALCASDFTIKDTITVDTLCVNNLGKFKDVEIEDSLIVNGMTTFRDDVKVNKDIFVNQNVTVMDSLTVCGSIIGDCLVPKDDCGKFRVKGDLLIEQGLCVDGKLSGNAFLCESKCIDSNLVTDSTMPCGGKITNAGEITLITNRVGKCVTLGIVIPKYVIEVFGCSTFVAKLPTTSLTVQPTANTKDSGTINMTGEADCNGTLNMTQNYLLISLNNSGNSGAKGELRGTMIYTL